MSRSKPSKRKAGRKRKLRYVSVSKPPRKLGGDHGTDMPAATDGTEVVPLTDADGKNPNHMGRRQRVSVIDQLHKKGLLTQRQYQAAQAIQCAYETLGKGQGQPPLKVRVDSTPRPDAVISAQVDAQSRVNHVMKPVRWRDKRIVMHVCVENRPVTELIAGGAGRTRRYNRLRDNLDLVANHLRY